MLEQAITFGPFRLDPRGGLMQGTRRIRLTPKAFSLLCVLAGERGRVVSKEHLFNTLWPRAAVGDAALVSCIQELRKALRDDSKRPRYIETLHRRGYRFIGQAGRRVAATPFDGLLSPDATMVGRGAELAQLDEALALARTGKRQVVMIAGEAGIGKTTLVRAFLDHAAQAQEVHIAWGQSAEHYGTTEPYHPILDALPRACRAPWGDHLLQVLDRCAPLWLTQMPTLVAPSRLRALQNRTAGATPERMQRELTDALEVAAAAAPLVLWLEDLHWADVSTIDWLAAFARRPEPARVLVIGTYRAGEAAAEGHAVHALRDELHRHGRSHVLALGPLSRAAVGEYLDARFTPRADAAALLARLAGEVHRRTEGSPLFMVGVLNELVARGLLSRQNGTWSLSPVADLGEFGIPRDLRHAIERRLERLDPVAARLLEVASAAGQDFSVAAVAAAAARPVGEVDRVCGDIAREQQLLQATGTEEWPDGTIASRFGFVHALYREGLYERLPAGRRVELHRRLGERLAAAYGERADEIAAQLALHFERGRDAARAVLHFRKAGEMAVRYRASHEAAAHFSRALELLASLPENRARDELEVSLRLALSAPMVAIHGLGAPVVEANASDARRLCERIGDAHGRFAAHRVIWNHSLMRHPVPTALSHARGLMDEAGRNPVELALAHRALGCSLIYAGEHREADRLLQEGIRIADRVPDAAFTAYGEHPGMICRVFGAWTKALMGQEEEAERLADAGVEHARRRAEPHGLAFALVTVGLVDLFQRDLERARRVAAEVLALSQEYKLPQWIAFAHEIQGWVACRQGDLAAGIALMEQALKGLHATGARTHSSRILANLAESCLAAGRPAAARCHLDAALAHRETHGEHYYATELFRLQALVLAQEGAAAGLVEASLSQALAIARAQEAGLLEARAIRTLAEYGIRRRAPVAEKPGSSRRPA
jgi:DNA-binding winged helix-turn-helix (wHTH) protein/tetratricopeptide (TPR) repeat protein